MTNTGTTPTPTTSSNAHTAGGLPFGEDDPRWPFAVAVATAGAAIDGVRLDQLDDPTPCDGFDVRRLLSHLVGVLHRVEAVGLGTNPLAVPSIVEGVADDAWPAAFADAAHRVQAAFTDDAVLDRMVVLPWRRATAGEQLLGYVNELTVHTWDLASATGQQPVWHPTVLDVSYAAIHETLPVAERADLFASVNASLPAGAPPLAPPFADAVPVADDAPAIDRLVAWNGRRP